MSFNANIDIAISFSHLKMCSLRQQGLLKFRVCLFHSNEFTQNQQTNPRYIFCHPYSILREEKQKKSHGLTVTSSLHSKIQTPYINSNQPQNKHPPTKQKHQLLFKNTFNKIPTSSHLPTQASQKIQQKNESELDLESQFYYSKSFPVMHEKQNHQIMQTCLFRTYVDTEKFQDCELRCLVEILFCPETSIQDSNAYKAIARCECKIRKIYDISTFLPLVFDEFDGVTLEGIYQASLMDFRFDKVEENQQHEIKNFYQYLQFITNSFKRYETRQFYRYYRGTLEKQLIKIQQRHYDFLRVLEVLKKDQDFRRIRMNPNNNIMNMIDRLEGHNHHHGFHHHNQSSEKYLRKNESVSSSFKDNIYYNHHREKTSINSRSFQTNSSQSNIKLTYQEELCEEILKDFLSIKAQIFEKWTDYIHFTQQHIFPITEQYKQTYHILVKERLSGNVFSHKVTNVDWKLSAYEDSGKQHLKQAEMDKKKIKKDEQLWKETFLIDNEAYFTKNNQTIKIFEEVFEVNQEKLKKKKLISRHSFEPHSLHNGIYYKRDGRSSEKNGSITERKNSFPETSFENFIQGKSFEGNHEDHYVVLVHGYQASRQDFLLFKNCLEIKFKVKVYISTCNEGRTEDALEVMGKRLAVELQSFLNRSERSLNYKLSFIGHSMGGIIIRTALCYLQNIDRHLYSFISFSTPHLGYLYNPSAHIQAGLWFMNAWQKSDSIEELSMRDNEELRNCFLYKLSRSGSINEFKNLAFIGSCQDKYVPFESARVQQNSTLISEKLSGHDGQVLHEMIENMLLNIKCKEISRMDIVFNIEDSNFDTMIGRTGHVKFLSDRQFIKLFCTVFDKYFK